MGDLEELAEDVRARGLARVFAARGRELVRSPDGRRLIAGENLRELIRADPELRSFADGQASPEPSAPMLTRRTLVALAAAGLSESGVAAAHAAPMRDRPNRQVKHHPDLREANGSPVWYVEAAKFRNWGRTVRNTPAVTFVPRTKRMAEILDVVATPDGAAVVTMLSQQQIDGLIAEDASAGWSEGRSLRLLLLSSREDFFDMVGLELDVRTYRVALENALERGRLHVCAGLGSHFRAGRG